MRALRLLQTFPAPAHPPVPMGKSMVSLSFTFLITYRDFSSWTRAGGVVGALCSISEVRLAHGKISIFRLPAMGCGEDEEMGLSCGHKRKSCLVVVNSQSQFHGESTTAPPSHPVEESCLSCECQRLCSHEGISFRRLRNAQGRLCTWCPPRYHPNISLPA